MKYFEDDVYSNKYMAKVGGISTTELSTLERLHLVMLKFSLMITPTDYAKFCKEAVRLESQVLVCCPLLFWTHSFIRSFLKQSLRLERKIFPLTMLWA